jgi:Tol biopolymer transport system component
MRPLPLVAAVLAAAAILLPASAVALTPAPSVLAYVVFPKKAAFGQVWVASYDGTNRHKLADKAGNPLVSPSGGQVAYLTTPLNRRYALRVVGVGGTGARTLAAGTAPDAGASTAWSPDGQRIVTVLGSELGRETLVVVDVATGQRTTIATGYFTGASFSPDGQTLVYARAAKATQQGLGGDLYRVPAAGGTPVKLTSDQKSISPVWGPTSIAYTHVAKPKKKYDSPKANVWLIAPDGSGARALTTLTIPYLMFGLTPLAWSADGTRLVAEYGGQDYGLGYTVDVTTGAAKGVGKKGSMIDAYGISRDGTTVLAAKGGIDPQGPHDVVTIPWGGGAPTTVVKNAWFPSWNR